MRNLALICRKSHQYDDLKARLMVQHVFENVSFVYSDKNTILKINHDVGKAEELCQYEGVVAIEFVQINDCVCFATESGDIVQYNLGTNQYDIEGRISHGIETMSWSPDQELVVFVTKARNVTLMFSTFDMLIERSLDEKAEKEFMTVGWGKKETQFHGSVGKDNRKTAEVKVQNADELDQSISCCWRGDGEYFAVNFVGVNGRMFKVFNKEGSMQYVSESCENLQVPIAWKPSGLWIAKPEVLKDKYTITLFERNGLKHNEMVLPFSEHTEKVVSLCWSQDSDVLAIETRKTNGNHVLYFYTICNYHWYMKYHLEFSAPIVYNWSQSYAEPKTIHIIDNHGSYCFLKFDFTVNHSSGESVNDETVVTVIDGNKLLMTNFKSKMMPPPMACLDYHLDNPVNLVSFIQKSDNVFDSNSFMTVDQSNNVTFFRCIFDDIVNGRRLKSIEKVKSIQLNNIKSIDHAIWINQSRIMLTNENTIHLYNTDTGDLNHIQLEDAVACITRVKENCYAAQLTNGLIFGIVVEDEFKIAHEELVQLPEFCERVAFIVNNEKMYCYALKVLKKKLYLNSKEIATEVTSFAVSNDKDFLIYTTIGELKFIKVSRNPEEVVETRRIERGSKITTLVKDKAQVIFQLPRGNLEAITPRILSLKIIQKQLNVPNYKLAFDLLRKERINLNFLIDVQPEKFLNELHDFVLQIDNINWLNLFLTELKNEDVTETMYTFCDKPFQSNDLYHTKEKISFICGRILEIFEKLGHKKYILPSITCHVKNESFEQALQLIWDLKKSGGSDKESDDAIKYLLYLIDINILYNIALGMYDYQLVMFVAQKSQKDPKEYVPFLQELNSLEPAYAKYKIDCYLRRYPKAIFNIAPLCLENEEKFNECLELIKKYNLYASALEAFESYDSCYQKICILYGDYLRVNSKFHDAILMYERGGDYRQALSSARNVLEWRKCLVLAKKCSFSETEIFEIALKLVHALNESKRYKESCEILRKFSHDNKRLLIETLLLGRLYDEALFEIAFSEGQTEYLEELVMPEVKNHFDEMMKIISDDKETFLQQKARLLTVRQEKIRKIQNPQDDDDDDTFSDTTSINSQSSRNTAKTFKSSKNRRKHERKLLNLKEGNKFEDVALLDSIWKLVQKIISVEHQTMVKDLIVTGVELRLDDMSRALQTQFKDLLLTLKHSMDEIWVIEMLSAGKYPETEEEMEMYNISMTTASRMSYDLIKPEQRYKPKMNIIEFEMDLFRDHAKKIIKF